MISTIKTEDDDTMTKQPITPSEKRIYATVEQLLAEWPPPPPDSDWTFVDDLQKRASDTAPGTAHCPGVRSRLERRRRVKRTFPDRRACSILRMMTWTPCCAKAVWPLRTTTMPTRSLSQQRRLIAMKRMPSLLTPARCHHRQRHRGHPPRYLRFEDMLLAADGHSCPAATISAGHG